MTLPSPLPRAVLAMLLVLPALPAAAAPGEEPAPVSLRERLGAAMPAWLHDFSYRHLTNRAQRQEVVVYTMDMKREHVRLLRERNLPWVGPTPSADADWVVGYSKGWWGENPIPPQPIFGYQITDPEETGEKLRVVLTGSNHAREDPACWSLHGMIDFLVSTDPVAAELRRKIVFFVYPVVNPDGKLYAHSPVHRRMPEFRSVNGNPELSTAGESNHNRVWLTNGQFTSIDVTKRALLQDTGGSPDYLLDFHGIPVSDFAFVDLAAAESPLGRVLRNRGINLRRSTNPDYATTLRTWATLPADLANKVPQAPLAPVALLSEAWSTSPGGLHARAGFTPELTNAPKLDMLERGRRIALAFHDVLTGAPPYVRRVVVPADRDRRPPVPAMAWLLAGDAQPHTGLAAGVLDRANPVPDGPFAGSGNRALHLTGSQSSVRFEVGPQLDRFTDLTVSVWVKGGGEHRNARYIVSRFQATGDQRSFALMHLANSSEVQVTLSADGTADRDKVKRFLSTGWPEFEVIGPEWRHLAFTFSGGANGTLRLYLDGMPIVMTADGHYYDDSPVPALHPSGQPLILGALDGSGNSFLGAVSELAVWDRALSAEEIIWLYRNSLRSLTP